MSDCDCCFGFDPSDPLFAYLGHFRNENVLREGHNVSGQDDADAYNQTAEQYGGAGQAPGTTSLLGFGSSAGNPL